MRLQPLRIEKIKAAQGFSIIEVMIAICVLSIGLLGMTALQTSAVKNNRTGNTYSQASALARSQMEILKNGDISDSDDLLNPAAFPTTTSHPDNPLDENGQPGGIYNVSWTVDNYMEDTTDDGIGDTASDFARTITITVTFPFAGDGTRQVTLTSIITGGGV